MMSEDNLIKLIKEMKAIQTKLESHERAIITLKNHDKIARDGLSNMQNFFLGLFKKMLSKINNTSEEKTNLLQWAEIKEVMCNNPNHLAKFSVKSITKYCGTDPTCPTCRKLEKSDNFAYSSLRDNDD